jgi:hypothetical protein
MPIIQGAIQDTTQEEKGKNLATALSMILQGVHLGDQESKDTAYRKAAAKLLGVNETDLGSFKREDLNDIVKEGYKNKITPKKWEPSSQEEALTFEKAKAGLKGDLFSNQAKEKESQIRLKIANKEPITKSEKAFYEANTLNKFIPNGVPIIDDNVAPGSAPANPGGLLKSLLGGAGQMGNAMNPISGFINMIRPQAAPGAQPISTAVAPALPVTPVATSVTTPIVSPEAITPEMESLIKENMAAYGKSREEIIGALKAKGYLKG